MATYTEKYKFKKPASTDPVDIQDINNNMDKAEAALFKKADIGENGKVLESQLPPIPESDYMPFHGHTTKTADELKEPGYYMLGAAHISDGCPLDSAMPVFVEVVNNGVFGWQKLHYMEYNIVFVRPIHGGSYGDFFRVNSVMPFHGHTTKKADELTEPGYYINEKPLKSNGYPLTANPPCIVEVFNDGMLGWQKVFYPNFERSFIRSFNEGKYSSGYKEFVMKDCTGD